MQPSCGLNNSMVMINRLAIIPFTLLWGQLQIASNCSAGRYGMAQVALKPGPQKESVSLSWRETVKSECVTFMKIAYCFHSLCKVILYTDLLMEVSNLSALQWRTCCKYVVHLFPPCRFSSLLMREHVFACYGFPMECALSILVIFHVLISSHYGVFIFLWGVESKPVGTLFLQVLSATVPPALARTKDESRGWRS